MNEECLIDRIKELPVDLQKEVLDFIEFLLRKRNIKNKDESPNNNFNFDWEGGLSEFAGCYTSVELQHKAMEWR
ncbi:DUF2281 domain-containing protein [Desulfothermus sp.]